MKIKFIKSDASLILLILIILLFIIGIVVSIYTFRSNPVDDALSSNRVINVLYVIEENKMPVSTYVLMYYPATRRAAVFDIPGDLGLLLARINRVDRIDRVYDSNRIAAFENEIEKLLGIEINFSIVITKDNLVSIVDLLEGVEIFIPSYVSYISDDQIILFPSGLSVLDGDKAALYATYSLSEEDSEVPIVRRQRFFLGLINRQIQMNEKLNNPSMAKIYYSFFKTNMNQRTLGLLFNEFVYIDTDRTNIQSVARVPHSANLREVSGQMLIIPHWDGNLIKEIVRQTLGALTREIEDHFIEQSLTVEVLNGTAVNGLAGRTAELLRSFGYDVISVGNADRNSYESTVIIHRAGDEESVNDFADLIRCRNIRREIFAEEVDNETDNQDIEYKADITLLIGRNFNGRYVSGN
ncbi:MAG: LCP family protein [Treponema sp.]|nr:LCP family protein [Treponema sp.]MCL2251840.1 LCP family protein [Treponema sp.]